ncbi:MAG TPA: TPM domain-containing protein, partial [Labilithrix sp.]|nr:TPM domain-containing protein [Labilithrix sp.]
MQRDHRSLCTWFTGIAAMLLLVFSSRIASAYDVPSPQGAVTDTAGKLTSEDDQYLEQRIAQYKVRSGNEIGVLIVGTLGGESIEDVAYQVFNRWGVGKAGRDNGVLIVIAPAERRTRIETGKGIGDRLTDVGASHILAEQLGPYLRAGRFRAGIDATLGAIEHEIEGGPVTSTSPASPSATNGQSTVSEPDHSFLIVLVIALGGVLLPMVLLAIARMAGRARARSHHRRSDGYDP